MDTRNLLGLPRIFIAVALLALVPRGASAAWELPGAIGACVPGTAAFDCALNGGGHLAVELYADGVVRIRITPLDAFEDRPTGALVPTAKQPAQGQVFDTPGAVFLVSPQLTLALFKSPLQLAIWRADGTLVSATREFGFAWDRDAKTVAVNQFAIPGEHYLGLGERGGPIERRGRQISMRNTDHAAFNSFTDPLYISIPFFYMVRDGKAAGVYVDSGATPFFDLDSSGNGLATFGSSGNQLDYYVMAGPEPLAVAAGYRQLTGPNQIPPIWTLGYHQSRYSYNTQEEVLSVAWYLRTLAVPADVLYFDIDYLDQLRMFSWNPLAFPDPAGMNLQLKQWNFRSVNIMEPLNHTGDPMHPLLSGAGYYLRGPNGQSLINQIWFGWVSWLDFSKSGVRDWYSGALQWFMGTYHIDGVWNDLNEPAANYMPEAIYDFDGQPRTDLEARNLYALQEAKTSYEAQRQLRPNTRPWVFSRSGFAGQHRYGAMWGGDADTAWWSLRTNVELSLSMGLSGQPFFGHDIGGFLGSPSPELFLRWMTFSAYTPLFRNHAINYAERREPWAFGEPYLGMIRNIVNARYRLIPYIYSLFKHDATSGSPVIAPLPFHFPGDPTTFVINDQFMLGPDMLVAPVLDEGAFGRYVYLPGTGGWIEERTDTRYTGGQWVFALAAIDQIPVFIRESAIVPRAPVAQSTAEQPLNRRSLDIYCAGNAGFDLYDDDGTSLAHEQGEFLVSRLTCTPGAVTTVGIERVQGSWLPPADRQWSLTLHRTAAPFSVRKNGVMMTFVGTEAALANASEGWTYTSGDKVLVKVADQAAPLSITLHHQ